MKLIYQTYFSKTDEPMDPSIPFWRSLLDNDWFEHQIRVILIISMTVIALIVACACLCVCVTPFLTMVSSFENARNIWSNRFNRLRNRDRAPEVRPGSSHNDELWSA